MRASTLRNIAAIPHPLSLLGSSTGLSEIRQIHAQLLISGLLDDPRELGKFAAGVALSRPENAAAPPLEYAEKILSHDGAPPTVFALNSLIRAHSKHSSPHLGFDFYRKILRSNGVLRPDNYTFTFLVRCCAGIPSAEGGAAVHAAALRRGFAGDAHVQSGLIHMYAEVRFPDSCRKVYAEMESPDLVSQTAMVAALARCGEIDLARDLFDRMPHRDNIAWNAMIAGYEQVGRAREALRIFHEMQIDGNAAINEGTMVSVLSACGQLGALDHGRWAHNYISKAKLRLTLPLGTALVDMYAKCGDAGKAIEVFDEMPDRNITTWSAAINGMALNGAVNGSLSLFRRMKDEQSLPPNEITFLALLRGCSVAGMVEDGLRIFAEMREFYKLEPWPEHYGCLVDLYGRAGRLEEAMAVMNSIPGVPHAGAWGALLSACRTHDNPYLGEMAASKITELEKKNDGAYVLLSNLYAGGRKWAAADCVRELMKARGVSKEPGFSAVEISGELHEFFSGDKSHKRFREMEEMMVELSQWISVGGR